MKTILTMDELVKFCAEQNFHNFSSSEQGYELAVKIPSTFEIDETDDSNSRGMLRLKYKLYHIGRNRNGSNVSEDSAKESLPTIAHRPVLASIHQLDNGEWDFHSHDMEEYVDENGETQIRYIESPVGAFSGYPDEQPFIAYDEETKKDFVFAYAYIPKEYTKASEIIERKGGSKNSVELHIEEMAYDAKEKVLDLKKFYVAGSTLLGSEKDGTPIEEGMLGSRADIADFKAEPQVFEKNTELIKVLENLNETLSHFDIKNLGKEVNEVKKKELEEIQEELFDLTDGENADGEDTSGETTDGNTDGEATDNTDANPETQDNEEESGTRNAGDEPQPLSPAINDDDPDILKKIEYTIKTTDGVVREFGLSVANKLDAAFNLVNATYGEEDNDFYAVDMFEDEGYLEMYGFFTNKNYRQTYSMEGDSISLTGERIEIYSVFVTQEEKDALESMKANYSEITEKLRRYEEEPQKMEILNSEDYSKVSSTKEFEELKLQKNHFDLEIDEVIAKADAILLSYAKHSNFSVQTEETAKDNFVKIPTLQKKASRYGTLFVK